MKKQKGFLFMKHRVVTTYYIVSHYVKRVQRISQQPKRMQVGL